MKNIKHSNKTMKKTNVRIKPELKIICKHCGKSISQVKLIGFSLICPSCGKPQNGHPDLKSRGKANAFMGLMIFVFLISIGTLDANAIQITESTENSANASGGINQLSNQVTNQVISEIGPRSSWSVTTWWISALALLFIAVLIICGYLFFRNKSKPHRVRIVRN